MYNSFVFSQRYLQERMRLQLRPIDDYPIHIPSSSRASLDRSDARDLLQRHGLPVESVIARPSAELYNRCKLADPNGIRLLRLFPAAEQAASAGIKQPLVAQIFSGSLLELKGKYETLSYVWGSEEKPNSIIILFVEPGTDSKEALMFESNITENLWLALTDLRSLYHHRDIWTDALCINQDNIPEKNDQVTQMRDVYAGSQNTLAYIGPRFNGLDALVAFRDCLPSQSWFVPRPMAPDHAERGQYMLFRPEQGIVRVNQVPSALIIVLMQRVIGFFVLRRTFGFVFPRFWAQIIATGLVASDLRNTLPLMFFKNKFSKFFSRGKPDVIFPPHEIVHGIREFFASPWFRRVWIVQECVVSRHVRFLVGREPFDIEEVVLMLFLKWKLKSIFADSASYEMFAFLQMLELRKSKTQASPSLSTFLFWAWNSRLGEEATNPRDRIFALIGLLSEKNPAFFIDYTLDTHEIFSRYGRVLIQSPEGFMLLEDPRRHEGLNMPSWIPDFARRNDQTIYDAHYLYSCSDGLASSSYQLRLTEKSIEVNAILLGGIDFIGRQYVQLPKGVQNGTTFSKQISTLHYDQDGHRLNQLLIIANLEPRNDIRNIMKNTSVQLPKGLNAETATEVLVQTGIFLDQTAGSLGAAANRQMYPVEKYPDARHSQELLTKTVVAARYWMLHTEGFLMLDTVEDFEELVVEIRMFFEECSTDFNQDRSKLFHRLAERSHNYPKMWREPLFRALSQEDWPPKSMKNDESIPEEIYNDDNELFHHWMWSFSYQCETGQWAGRRLAKTADGYLCNADKDAQIGDRIAVVADCRMPLILRPKEDGTYRVVGHAYVMGLMYGEAMDLGLEPGPILLS
jgi:hypothetical protein